MTDENIVQLFLDRDESGITAARERYGRLLTSIACNILHSEQDAEECESETLLRAWNSIPPAKPERLCAYLCRIARRLALDRHDYNSAAKRSGDTLPIDELSEYIGSGSAADMLSERELSGFLNSFLRAQDKTTRIIFMRRFWFGDSIADISKRLHVSESMVKSRISRTLKKLREYLRKEGYEL